MTNQQLRAKLLDRIDSVLVQSLLLCGEDRKLLFAVRGFVATMTGAELDLIRCLLMRLVPQGEQMTKEEFVSLLTAECDSMDCEGVKAIDWKKLLEIVKKLLPLLLSLLSVVLLAFLLTARANATPIPQAPRAPQAPRVAKVFLASCPVTGLADCQCGCLDGGTCTCWQCPVTGKAGCKCGCQDGQDCTCILAKKLPKGKKVVKKHKRFMLGEPLRRYFYPTRGFINYSHCGPGG